MINLTSNRQYIPYKKGLVKCIPIATYENVTIL